MFRKLMLLCGPLFFAMVAYAQETGTIKGTVRDSSGTGVADVSIAVEEDGKYYTVTNNKGEYSFKVPAGKSITLVFSSINIFPYRTTATVAAGGTQTVNPVIRSKTLTMKGVDIVATKSDDTVGTLRVKSQSSLPSVSGDFNANLAYQAVGVFMKNELSSSYSVRGGNFDENLVYVNDFEVYRPFLIRSGQQEGLSFVNGNMVDNVKFSSGGFQAKYGDKMASVMDVTYRRPRQFAGSAYGSLLGFAGNLEGCDKKQRFTFTVGVRQKLSQYILGSLDEKGQYNPNFLDVQAFLTYQIIENKLSIEYLGNYARNRYVFKPVNRETTFGVLTDVKRLTIYFDGQEVDRYQNLTNGLSLVYLPNRNLRLKFLGAYYLLRENETYDILGEYYLSQVESDLSKSSFGDILYSLGVGGLHKWTRDTYNSDIYYGGHRGGWTKKGHNLQWGLDYKREIIYSKISEWNRLDSAGHSLVYSLTPNGDTVIYYPGGDSAYYLNNSKPGIGFQEVVRPGERSLTRNRISAFLQDTWKKTDSLRGDFSFNYGVRVEWDDISREPVITPRVQFSFKPLKHDLVFTVSGGTYYQPAFYREMLNFKYEVNQQLQAQKSAHAVVGLTYGFKAWKRDFNFTTELYYKYMWDLVPYEFDDVLIKYYGANQARGYAAGIDLRLNGELAKGAESWISMSVMQTGEDIIGDHYTEYYDTAGEKVAYNQFTASTIIDSSTVYPGYRPRPTDQRVNFAMFFQDYIPKFPFIKLHLSMVFGSGLPFGPPRSVQFRNKLRIPPYRRVDIGFSGQLWNPEWARRKNKVNQGIKSVWASIEIFNIFGITNTISYLWISDIAGTRYAVPNYLTSRRINAKVIFNF